MGLVEVKQEQWRRQLFLGHMKKGHRHMCQCGLCNSVFMLDIFAASEIGVIRITEKINKK